MYMSEIMGQYFTDDISESDRISLYLRIRYDIYISELEVTARSVSHSERKKMFVTSIRFITR